MDKEKRNEYINYIQENINEMQIDQLRNIFQKIYDSINKKDIMEKGDGTYIKFNVIPDDIILYIYNYIKSKLDKFTFDITSSEDESEDEIQENTFEL